MYGIDISNWQKNINLSADDYEFAIIKATEGVTYTDPEFNNFAVQLTKTGKLIGCYHYARPDNHDTLKEIHKEATHFVNVVSNAGLIGKAILVLDWEQQPVTRTDLAQEWIDWVRHMTGVTPFIYASESVLLDPRFTLIRNECPVWVAKWVSSSPVNLNSVRTCVHNFVERSPSIKWTIWQFTDRGRYNGWADNIDLNYTKMTSDDWMRFAAINGEPINTNEMLSDDMKWAIKTGIFKGFTDGTYKPKEPITREQMASVIRRIFEKKQ